MAEQTVFIVGATGETGRPILNALIQDGSFDITCLIRTASAGKPAVQRLKDRGLRVVTGDLSDPVEKLAALLQGIDTVLSVVFPGDLSNQIPLVDAAVQAGVRRFVPCNWGTPCARGGVLSMRDVKESVHDHVFRQRLGFTIVDVGYWYQMSYPRVPSGKFDYAALVPVNDVFNGGTAPNMLIHRADVGRITARIIKDERTLNKRVYVYGDVLTQNEINGIIEEKTGEKLELTPRSAEEVRAAVEDARKALGTDAGSAVNRYKLVGAQYNLSKYVRFDNTPENAEYLGYVSGRGLYPDFRFASFASFVDELVAGKADRPYPHLKA